MKKWQCRVCGFIHEGKNPPKECPRCSSAGAEFREFEEYQKLKYDGSPIDLLLINGSSHARHNSAILADIIQEVLKEKRVNYKRFDLNEYKIDHCWCCYSMAEAACTYPCRNQLDDMPAFHQILIAAKAVIVISPINWNNMSARLKDFLDRCTAIQNRTLLGKSSLTTGKVLGILVDGHEDGAIKTAMDIYLYFEQMGYILAPFGLTYRTHGAIYESESDQKFFSQDEKLKKDVAGVVNNVLALMKLDLEKKLAKDLIAVSE